MARSFTAGSNATRSPTCSPPGNRWSWRSAAGWSPRRTPTACCSATPRPSGSKRQPKTAGVGWCARAIAGPWTSIPRRARRSASWSPGGTRSMPGPRSPSTRPPRRSSTRSKRPNARSAAKQNSIYGSIRHCRYTYPGCIQAPTLQGDRQMRQQTQRVKGRLLFVAGLLMAGYPLVATLPAFQGQAGQAGGGQAPPRILNAPQHALLQGFRWREIGPTGQGGRIDDLAVDEKNPSTYYIGYAVSGLWKTTNMGTTFRPLMDDIAHSIGDLALAPSNPNIIYVGTGEPNNRQSSSFGHGVYKSTTGGEVPAGAPAGTKAWEHIGLENTQSIARIIVHPKNPDIVWVAAVGHLFGPNDDRGIFMSTDGGKTWNKTLYINQDVGATELVINPANPNHLMAATYERRRTNWGFVGGGPGSGLHESMDGGKSWKKISPSATNGLPRGTMGRIGLDWSRSNPNVIYAQIEVAMDKEPRNPGAEAPAVAAVGAEAGAAPDRHRTRNTTASGARLTAARPGRSRATRISGRCITARFAWTRTTRTSSMSAA